MGLRGPKSENGIHVPGFSESRPSAPAGMTKRAKKLWGEIVESLPSSHFRPGDYPLLRAYCESEALHYQATQSIESEGAVVKTTKILNHGTENEEQITVSSKPNPWVAIQTQTAHTMAQLAMKLRLCVNSRIKHNEERGGKAKSKSARRGLMFGDNQ